MVDFFTNSFFLFLILFIKSLLPMLVVIVSLLIVRKQITKKLVISAYLALILVLLPANLELYFTPYPLIDTSLKEGFTIDEWEKIVPGMSKSEVIEKIGDGYISGPFTVQPQREYGETQCINYTVDGRVGLVADFAWIGIGVCYTQDDIVTRTYSTVVHD